MNAHNWYKKYGTPKNIAAINASLKGTKNGETICVAMR
jgi:hypothetical protein